LRLGLRLGWLSGVVVLVVVEGDWVLRLMLMPLLSILVLIVRERVVESLVVMVVARGGFVRVEAGRRSGRRIE
jgi:hypothetical protein